MLPHMILRVWDLLSQAYYGDSHYGGDMAEVYFYLLQARNPAYEQTLSGLGPDELYNGPFGEKYLKGDTKTANTFKELFLLFEEEWDCQVSIQTDSDKFTPVTQWQPEPFHRLYVRVSHRLSEVQRQNLRELLDKE